MNNPSLHYTCVALAGVNKGGSFEKDEHGYYKVLLGALNIFNHAGIYYLYEESKHIFEKSGEFMRRIAAGNLHGEEDHPAWEKGMTEDEFIDRNLWIETKNVAFHIRDVWTVHTDEMCNDQPVVEIWGWIKPDRERGPFLQAALDNPHQNVCFSLRAIVLEGWMNGVKVRKIDRMCTFDWVIEDGLRICNKYSSLSRGKGSIAQESTRTMAELKLNEPLLRRLASTEKTSRVGTESHRGNVRSIAKDYLSKIVTKPGLVKTGLAGAKW